MRTDRTNHPASRPAFWPSDLRSGRDGALGSLRRDDRDGRLVGLQEGYREKP